MIRSSRLVTVAACSLMMFGGVTALKSNDLNNVKIFTYQMKPIFSPGDRQPVEAETVEKKADKIVAEIKKDIEKQTVVASKVQEEPKKILSEKQVFLPIEVKTLPKIEYTPLSSTYRIASSSPMNIIPDYSLPKQFVRSYERLVMGKGIEKTAMRNSTSYRGTVRQNGPVMLRPSVSSEKVIKEISSARLPISSAKAVGHSQTAMR